ERTLMGYDAVCRQYEKSLPR
ncbi:TPA: hypothetical protein ACHJY3_005500, partial [Escherichia coli]